MTKLILPFEAQVDTFLLAQVMDSLIDLHNCAQYNRSALTEAGRTTGERRCHVVMVLPES